jgi:hypothetical protein
MSHSGPVLPALCVSPCDGAFFTSNILEARKSVERQRPDTSSDEIDLYIRTYYSLLRSSGEVRVRSFEEAHIYSNSSLHEGAKDSRPDVSAFGYAAGRVPEIMPDVRRILFGQSEEQFVHAGANVVQWERLSARGRRRPYRYDGRGTLAAFIASASDIDDLVPILTAYQIEWNKMHQLLATSAVGQAIAKGEQLVSAGDAELEAKLAEALDLPIDLVGRLKQAFGKQYSHAMKMLATTRLDVRLQLLAGSFNHYQRAAQRWWSGIEPVYLKANHGPQKRPVYFVSSNTHSLANLLGGYAIKHKDMLLATAKTHDPDGVWSQLERAVQEGSDEAANLLYFVLRHHVRLSAGSMEHVQRWDEAHGIVTVPDPGHVEVGAQVIELDKVAPELLDPRLHIPGIERLRKSEAVIINIDYPLGMAAYQLLSRVGQGAGEIRGLYLMGKAATLNARVGDVMISKVVQDEHSKNTYMVSNCFTSGDVAPYLRYGTVFDSQKALTVRSAFLQNREYMGVFYREGYTVLEMEAGPYLSAIFELVDPSRHPIDELVNVGERTSFDVGILHYASDTPYSRRQSLLSKSMGFFGIDSTYACAIAITRRILQQEIQRL